MNPRGTTGSRRGRKTAVSATPVAAIPIPQARADYLKAAERVRAMLVRISDSLEFHDTRAEAKPRDYGFFGDLQDVFHKLARVEAALSGSPTIETWDGTRVAR